jgi:hypothetical protein
MQTLVSQNKSDTGCSVIARIFTMTIVMYELCALYAAFYPAKVSTVLYPRGKYLQASLRIKCKQKTRTLDFSSHSIRFNS